MRRSRNQGVSASSRNTTTHHSSLQSHSADPALEYPHHVRSNSVRTSTLINQSSGAVTQAQVVDARLSVLATLSSAASLSSSAGNLTGDHRNLAILAQRLARATHHPSPHHPAPTIRTCQSPQLSLSLNLRQRSQRTKSPHRLSHQPKTRRTRTSRCCREREACSTRSRVSAKASERARETPR